MKNQNQKMPYYGNKTNKTNGTNEFHYAHEITNGDTTNRDSVNQNLLENQKSFDGFPSNNDGYWYPGSGVNTDMI